MINININNKYKAMMNIVTRQVFGVNPYLLTSIKFYASKMQASSTQNNRDSAGRRLGYVWDVA